MGDGGMARYRTCTVEFGRQVVEGHPGGGTSPNRLARRHDISRGLLRTRVNEHEAGDLAGGRPTTPDRRACEADLAPRPAQGRPADDGARAAQKGAPPG